jgi:DNA processing protein
MSDNKLIYQIAMGNMPGIGDINAKKLISYFGDIEAIFKESYRNLVKINGIGSGLAKSLTENRSLERAKKELEFIIKHDIRTSYYLDKDYPERLKECPDSPILIYYKGDMAPVNSHIISIIGTRNATRRGRDICNSIISGLADKYPDLVIVSGLAYGVDICAHRSALKNDLPTIGVMAHGFKTLYPSLHASTAREMLKKGALVTDFLSDEPPDRNNFLKRNRIIAGLSDATLVIESGIKGGAMVTADIAMSYNREVLAVPGYPQTKYSAGCNLLIKSHKASLIETSNDIEYFLNWIPEKLRKRELQINITGLDPLESRIIECLKENHKITADQLARKIKEPAYRLSPSLLNLEFAGIIASLPGNIYKLNKP